MAGIIVRRRKIVFKAPMDVFTPIGAFLWSFIGADTENNKGQQTEMRESLKVDKAQNRSVTQTIKNL